ncbi:MAG TPA: phosphatase PAP2 family protein [Chitinophagales bacterium]|nr:phosphatase PAP2 family protein [Chitinophagales bacterium]
MMKIKYHFCLLPLLFVLCFSFGQTPYPGVQNNCDSLRYNLSWKRELAIITPAIILVTTDLFLPPPTLGVEDLAGLDISDIPAFERDIIYFDSAQGRVAEIWSDGINALSFGACAAAIFSSYKEDGQVFKNAVVFAEGFALTYGVTEVLKSAVGRNRPYTYNDNYSTVYRLRKDPTSSFPSGHTSSTAYNCFFAASLIDYYYIDDENKWLRVINWGTAATIPIITGYLRTEAGKHFYTDIAGGYIIGAAIGLGVPMLHKCNNLHISAGNVNDVKVLNVVVNF